jgi:hypothetical protein
VSATLIPTARRARVDAAQSKTVVAPRAQKRSESPAVSVNDINGRILELQRQAGNRAVSGMLAGHAVGRSPLVVQRHASFEHRLLGDVPPGNLFQLGAHTDLEGSPNSGQVTVNDLQGNPQTVQRANVLHILDQEINRLLAWQRANPSAASVVDFTNRQGTIKNAVQAAAGTSGQPDQAWNVQIIAIPSTHPQGGGRPLLVTYGELNTLADFYGSVEELQAADPVKRQNVVQSVRKQSYEQLSAIRDKVRGPQPVPQQPQRPAQQGKGLGGFLSGLWGSTKNIASSAVQGASNLASEARETVDSTMFPGAFNMTGTSGELNQMREDKKGGSGTTAYTATLARNACHFAPESWHSWEDHHNRALGLAGESYTAGQQGNNDLKAAKLNEAMLVNGFGDHYLQDSYAAGHLMNKTAIMQMYVRFLDKNPRWNAGYTSDTTWRAFQNMAYNQDGVSDPGQYTKGAIGRRQIGTENVTTARNPQAVENTQGLPNFTWQNRFEMLGLTVPPAASPGTKPWKVLVWLQKQHGGVLTNRYDVNFALGEVETQADDIGIAKEEVEPALQDLLNSNIIYNVEESRAAAGARLSSQQSAITGAFTLRKEWVVSVTGDNERKFDAATQDSDQAQVGPNAAYEKMSQATVYKDYTIFMKDAFLQKATNAAHDHFCKEGLQVSTGGNQPLFKIYGDMDMMASNSSAGLRESATTANMSRDSIVETATTGAEPNNKNTASILARFPSHVLPPGTLGGQPISIEAWHSRDGQLENWLGPNVFEKMNAVINTGMGVVRNLGTITKDENVHGSEAF